MNADDGRERRNLRLAVNVSFYLSIVAAVVSVIGALASLSAH